MRAIIILCFLALVGFSVAQRVAVETFYFDNVVVPTENAIKRKFLEL